MVWTPTPTIRYVSPRPVREQAPGRGGDSDQPGEYYVAWSYDRAAMGLPADLELASPTTLMPVQFVSYSTGRGGADDIVTGYAEGDISTASLPDRLLVFWPMGPNMIELDYRLQGMQWVYLGVRTAWEIHPRTNWSRDFWTGVAFVATVYISAGAGGALAAEVGAAAIGAEAAAAYPALAQAVGNVAIGTAMNGGDVEAAVKGSVTGLATGYVGAGVAGAVDSPAIGRAAAAAAGAAIRGGDIDAAVLQSLGTSVIKGGAAMFADAWGSGSEPDLSGSFLEPINPVTYNPPDGGAFPDTGQSEYVFGGQVNIGFDPGGFNDGGPVLTTNTTPVDTSPVIVADDGSPGGWGADALDFLTNAALATIKVNAAYQATQVKPPVRVNTNPAGGAPVATPLGMLVTRNPLTGAVQTTRPATGTPYALGDGSGRTIINNGDGTFDLIAPDGTRRRISYAPGAPGEAPNWGAIALLAGGGFLALKMLKGRG